MLLCYCNYIRRPKLCQQRPYNKSTYTSKKLDQGVSVSSCGREELISSASAAIILHNISISSRSDNRLPHINRPKDHSGLTFQTPAADICTASTERENTNVPLLCGAASPFLDTLFILRFFLLAQQTAIFPAQTEGCLAHLIRGGRQRGNEGWRKVMVLRGSQKAPA